MAGGWVVNGSKTFITNGVRADFLVCAVRTTAEGGHGGISFLILESDMNGYEVSRKLEKLGWHSSDTGELSFTDVAVPDENLLGEENEGFKLIMANFQWERLLMSLGAVGGMDWCLRRTVDYALEREAFGRPIGKFQAIRHKIADMSTKLEVGTGDDATRPCACSPAVRTPCARSPPPSCSPSAPRSRSPTTPSRSTAATATCASTRSSAPSATLASGRSAAAPTRS